ncbi:MAG: redoxin domain-containing protein [Saprospiraceae bacterium]|nr:redoxin domain-containing protein [Saprospiraceae bacterium]
MNFRIILAVGNFILCFLIHQNMMAQKSANIEIRIDGYSEGWCKMIGMYGDQNYIVDSFLMNKNGHVVLKNDSLFAQGLYYILLPDLKNISILVDENQKFVLMSKKETLVGSMKVIDHTCNELYYKSLVIQEKLDSVSQLIKKGNTSSELKNQYDLFSQQKIIQLSEIKITHPFNFFTIFKTSGQNPVFIEVKKPNGDTDTFGQLHVYRSAFWNNTDLRDSRLLRTPVIANKLRRFIKELTPQHPDSIIIQADQIINASKVNKEMFEFISNWIALQYQPTKTTVMDGEAVYVHIIDTYFTSDIADWLTPEELNKLRKKTSEMRASLLNRKGPNVVSTDPDGKKRSLYEIQEPYIVIYMYAPNCEHCKQETPKLKAFYEAWKSKGVQVYAIALETNSLEWNQYIQMNGISDWVNVFDPTNASIYAKYYVDVTPEIYVLNPERIIIGKNLKSEQIPVIIEKDKRKKK